MNASDFLQTIKNKNAFIWGASNTRHIEYANANLQQQQRAILPNALIDLYKQSAGINLGTGYLFGPLELPNGIHFPIPSIVQINNELTNIPYLQKKTLFARNDLFWFIFDSFGVYYMLNNVNGTILRKYDSPYTALNDCLLGGKL